MAPEVFDGVITKAADVWAYGILAIEIII